MEEEDERDSFGEPISSHELSGTIPNSLNAPQSAMHVGTPQITSVRNHHS